MLMRSDLPRTADMVIVGGGIAGASTAFHAARAGIRPLILERRPAPVTHTTAASTGAFRLQFDNEEEMHLVRETVELLDQFAEITGQRRHDPRVRRQGYLWATTSPKRIEPQRLLVEQQHRWGQSDIELLSGDEVRSRFPYVGPDVLQARFRAGDGFLDPRQLALGLIEGSSAEVVVSCDVTGIAVTDDRVTAVGTSLGSVATTTVVVAAGPFSGVVASMAGVELPLETVVRHKVVVPDLPAVPPTAPMTIDDDTGAHWRPALGRGLPAPHRPINPPRTATRGRTARRGFRLPAARPVEPGGAGQGCALLGRRLARRVGVVDGPVRAVRHDTRSSTSAGRDLGGRAVDELRIQRPRDHGRSCREPPLDRPRHRPNR